MKEMWTDIPQFIAFLHFVAIITVLFRERKRADSTIAWVLTLLFLPVIGLLFYIFIGTARNFGVEKKFGKKQAADDDYKKVIKEQLDLIEHSEVNDKALASFRDMIMMNLKSGDSLYTTDNEVEILNGGKEKYKRLFEDIKNAKKHIHLMYYIFNDDKIGNKLVDLLCEKAKEGIEVRLIYDSFGNIKNSGKMFKRLKDAGGSVIKFIPNPVLNILRVNYRNHRKIAVIDGYIGYLGGINIGDEYMGLDPKKSPWRDTHIRIVGTSIVSLQFRFLSDWAYLTGESLGDESSIEKFFVIHPTDGSKAVQIVSSGPDKPGQQIKYGVLKMFNRAKKTLYIQTPYFIPDDSIKDALTMAIESGVDVRIMIPGIPDKKFVYHVTLSYVEELLNAGVRVYAYNGFLHSKMVVTDSAVTSIGSMNLDIRGFLLAFEVNGFIYDEEFSAECSEMFKNDILNCKEITLSEFKKRNVFRKIQESVYRILAPLM